MITSFFSGLRRFFRVNLFWVLVAGLGVFVGLEMLGTVSWLTKFVFYEGVFDFQLVDVLGFLVPFLFLVFLYGWLWIPCLGFMKSKVFGFKDKKTLCGLFEPLVLDKKLLVLFLFVFLVFSGFLVYFPVLTSHETVLVGSDSFHYFEVLSKMNKEGPLFVFGSDRPLTYLFLFFINFLTGFSEVFAVQFAPVLVACFLFLGIFWFVRVGTKNDTLSLICAVFTSFSFQLTVSVYAYYLGNWIGLFLVFLVFGFLLKAFNEKSIFFIFLGCLFSFGVFLSHPYTWYALMGSLLLVLVLKLVKILSDFSYQKRSEIYFLVIFLLVNFLFFIFYSQLPFGNSSVGSAGGLASNLFAVFDFSNLLIFDVVSDCVFNCLGGFFVNPVLLLLSVLGIYSVFKYNIGFVCFLVFWVISTSLMLFFVGSGNFFAYRLLYLVPFQVFAGLGFYQLWLAINRKELFSNFQKLFIKSSLVLGVSLSFLNYVFVCLESVPFFMI